MLKPTIIITGAGQRIGLFLAEKFLGLNFSVIALVRSETKALKDLQSLFPTSLEVHIQDFNEQKITVDFWDSVVNKKSVVGFVHCASTFFYDTVETATQQNVEIQQNVNCDVFIDACTSYMQSNRNIDSSYNDMSFIAFLDAKLDNLNKDHYSYTLSKLKLKSVLPFLAMSMMPKARVNAVSPGLTLCSGEQTQEQFNRAQTNLPFGYGANLESIFETVLLLLNQKTITGQNITVDAGQHLVRDKDIVFKNN